MNPSANIQTHPSAVSKGGAIATAATDYVPPEDLDVGLIKGHRWGTRTLLLGGAQEQFMVYDKDAHNVLSCMGTPELAASWANARLEREAAPPQDYSRRLAGTTYGSYAPAGSHILMHTVVDADGRILGESQMGRAAAVETALTALCARVDADDLTFEEFQRICRVARVVRGRGKAFGPGVIYDDDIGRAEVRAQLAAMRRVDPLLQSAGEGEGLLRGDPDLGRYLVAAESSLLQQVSKMRGDVVVLRVSYEAGASQVIFAYAQGAMSAESIQRACYQDYLDAVEASQDRLQVRERG